MTTFNSSCPHGCGGISRPNVYLFGDAHMFIDTPEVTKFHVYEVWTKAVQVSTHHHYCGRFTVAITPYWQLQFCIIIIANTFTECAKTKS